MWFTVRPRELGYVVRAPCRIEVDAELAATPAVVFGILSNGKSMRHWLADFVSSRWTSAPPHGVGSTRELMLKTMALRERILAWDVGERLTLSVYGMTAPLVREMVEEISLSPSGDGGTRIRWGLYYAPSLSLRLLHPLARAVFDKMLRDSVQALRGYVTAQRSEAAARA
jgi:hypothetical protein